MASKIPSNSVPQNTQLTKGPWLGVNGRIWRHTIGRVSNAVRVPLNLYGSVIQALKIIGKTAALPVTYSIVGIHSLITKNDRAYTGSMSLRGIAIDGVGFLRLLKTTGVCFKNVIVAPHVKSQGFVAGNIGTWVVISGGLQDYPKIFPVSQLFDAIILDKKNQSMAAGQPRVAPKFTKPVPKANSVNQGQVKPKHSEPVVIITVTKDNTGRKGILKSSVSPKNTDRNVRIQTPLSEPYNVVKLPTDDLESI